MNRHRSRKGAPGIVDVALRAGVSPATVSRFFNSPELVTPLGYIRDRMAGAMHNRFSGTIGLIVPTINNAIFSEMIEAFSNQLQRNDRTMLIARHNYNLDLEVSIVRSLLERRIDGVAIVRHDHSPIAMQMLAVRRTSVTCIGCDNRKAAEQVTEHLLELGHRDIAFLFPDTEHNDRARERKEGALGVAQRSGLKVPDSRIVSCPYEIAHAKSIALDIINTDQPSAIVCGNDIIAHGVVFAAQRSGLTLPRDLSIVGIGDFAGSAEIEPGLTTLRSPAKSIGSIAAKTMIQMSSAEPSGLQVASPAKALAHIELPTELIVRQSTAAVQ